MGALAHWLRSLDYTPPATPHVANQPAAHGMAAAPKCAASQLSATTSQK
jgi:hypothetical protein